MNETERYLAVVPIAAAFAVFIVVEGRHELYTATSTFAHAFASGLRQLFDGVKWSMGIG